MRIRHCVPAFEPVHRSYADLKNSGRYLLSRRGNLSFVRHLALRYCFIDHARILHARFARTYQSILVSGEKKSTKKWGGGLNCNNRSIVRATIILGLDGFACIDFADEKRTWNLFLASLTRPHDIFGNRALLFRFRLSSFCFASFQDEEFSVFKF